MVKWLSLRGCVNVVDGNAVLSLGSLEHLDVNRCAGMVGFVEVNRLASYRTLSHLDLGLCGMEIDHDLVEDLAYSPQGLVFLDVRDEDDDE